MDPDWRCNSYWNVWGYDPCIFHGLWKIMIPTTRWVVVFSLSSLNPGDICLRHVIPKRAYLEQPDFFHCSCEVYQDTPPKTNMEPKNHVFSYLGVHFQVPSWFSVVYFSCILRKNPIPKSKIDSHLRKHNDSPRHLPHWENDPLGSDLSPPQDWRRFFVVAHFCSRKTWICFSGFCWCLVVELSFSVWCLETKSYHISQMVASLMLNPMGSNPLKQPTKAKLLKSKSSTKSVSRNQGCIRKCLKISREKIDPLATKERQAHLKNHQNWKETYINDIPRTQMTLVLFGKGLVLKGLTFKNRGHWGSRYRYIWTKPPFWVSKPSFPELYYISPSQSNALY